MYADDTTIFGKSDFLTILDKAMVQTTDHIVNWFKINKLHRNPIKTQRSKQILNQNTEHQSVKKYMVFTLILNLTGSSILII